MAGRPGTGCAPRSRCMAGPSRPVGLPKISTSSPGANWDCAWTWAIRWPRSCAGVPSCAPCARMRRPAGRKTGSWRRRCVFPSRRRRGSSSRRGPRACSSAPWVAAASIRFAACVPGSTRLWADRASACWREPGPGSWCSRIEARPRWAGKSKCAGRWGRRSTSLPRPSWPPRSRRERPSITSAGSLPSVWPRGWSAGQRGERPPLVPTLRPKVEPGRVRFRISAPGARSVSVVGSWDDWTPPGDALVVQRRRRAVGVVATAATRRTSLPLRGRRTAAAPARRASLRARRFRLRGWGCGCHRGGSMMQGAIGQRGEGGDVSRTRLARFHHESKFHALHDHHRPGGCALTAAWPLRRRPCPRIRGWIPCGRGSAPWWRRPSRRDCRPRSSSARCARGWPRGSRRSGSKRPRRQLADNLAEARAFLVARRRSGEGAPELVRALAEARMAGIELSTTEVLLRDGRGTGESARAVEVLTDLSLRGYPHGRGCAGAG